MPQIEYAHSIPCMLQELELTGRGHFLEAISIFNQLGFFVA